MQETMEIWQAIAILKRAAPVAAEIFQASLDEAVDRELQRLRKAKSTEELFDSRARFDSYKGLADTWRGSEQLLRTHGEPA